MLDARLAVHRTDLDRAELGVRANVVPEVRVVLHHAGVDHELDLALVVLPVAIGRRDTDARERAEDRRACRSQPGAVGAPERRVGAERQQDRDVHAHAVGDVDRLVGVVEPDVDVLAEDDLLARDEAQRADEVAVAGPGDDPLVLPHREGMRARRADHQVLASCGLVDLPAQRSQLVAGLDGVRARIGRDLQDRLHELRLDLAVRRVLEERLDRVHQVERPGVADHQLLFDADRVARPGEVVLHSAASITVDPYTQERPNRRMEPWLLPN
jgi:hypothetical protein